MSADKLQFDSLDEAQLWVFEELLSKGRPTAPRGLQTLELPPLTIGLRFPRRRLLTIPERKWSLPLAVGELCWHLSGSDEMRVLEYYSPRWREFSDDDRVIAGSCYGHRIFERDGSAESQWDAALALLRADNSSRRALLLLGVPANRFSIGSRDVPCACVVQMLLRNGELDFIVFMRSNDAYLGFPYDVFLFTMLQEFAAAELGVQLGSYYHSVGSLHIYQEHISKAERMVGCHVDGLEMPPLEHLEAKETFLAFERAVRGEVESSEVLLEKLPVYWRQLGEILFAFGRRKQHLLSEGIISKSSPYRRLMERTA